MRQATGELTNATLAQVCRLVTDGTHDTPRRVDHGYPLIKAKEIVGGQLDFDSCDQISEEDHLKVISRSKPEAGDTLFAHIGASLGEAAYVGTSREFSIKNIALFKPNPEVVVPRYLYYLVVSPDFQALAKGSRTGSAQPFLSLGHLRSHPVRFHRDLTVQRRIASILSAYDDLIENNTRRIAILEEMARRIYEEWFVRFRFPGHEGMRMVESVLGLVPEGWSSTELGALLSVEKGLSYKGSGLTGSGVPMVNLKNILPGGGFRRDGTKPYSGEYKPRHVVRAGEIVLANTDLTQAGTVVGSPAIVPDMGVGECIFSHHIYAVRLQAALVPFRSYMYWLLAHDSFKSFAKGHAVGTTVLGMPKEGVTNFRFARPPEDLMRRFSSLASPIHDLAETLHAKNANLRATRDLLLPKLISGELDVSARPEPEALAT